jgi:DNA-binding transcriptional regulator LsrR (DeoR family)
MRDDNKLERIAEVARLYYKEGKSQAEIGQILGVSHSTISRMLKEAHEHKIVEVFIRQPVKLLTSFSDQLEAKFGLKKAYVVAASGNNGAERTHNLALQTAQVLTKTLQDGFRLGISTGSTVAATLKRFKTAQPMHVQVVPLHGSKGERPCNGNNLMHTLAEQLGRDFITLPAPWLMQTVEACQLITREKCVSSAIQLAENVDVALVGIGALNGDASETLWNGWIGKDALKALREAGAVGEICGKFFDKDGQVLDITLNERTIAINLNRLRGVANVVGVAGSEQKADAILAALRGDLINVLVTDSDAARKIIELADNGGSS